MKHGWQIMLHDLGQGTHPVSLGDAAEFLESVTGIILSEDAKKLLDEHQTGIPGGMLRSDMLVAKRGCFAMVELKTSQKHDMLFNLTLAQYIYYNRARKAGIPVKLVLVRLLDQVYVSISNYLEKLSEISQFRVRLNSGGPKPYMLKLIAKSPGCALAEIGSMMPRIPLEQLEEHLTEMQQWGLVFKLSDKWYLTREGVSLISTYWPRWPRDPPAGVSNRQLKTF